MDNYFINKPPFGKFKYSDNFLRFVNKGFRYLKLGYAINPIDTTVDMSTVEQRINYFHLLDNVIINGIDGDVVELGCFTGQCALLFQKTMYQRKTDKMLHLYDSFSIKFSEKGNIEELLTKNFIDAGLPLPILHKGFFEDTLHDQLPDKISFVHIDCGFGGNIEEHKKVVHYCLNEVYPKMMPGAICILMDYMDVLINGKGHISNAGVKQATDEFLTDKPEEIICLYGNQYFHAYFRKI